MKRKKKCLVWILAAMLLFTQLFVYAAEPKDVKEKERQKEIIQEEKTVPEELEETEEEKQTEKKDAPSSEEDRKQEEKPDFPLQPKREHIWDTAQNQTVRLRLGYTRCQFSIMTISEHYCSWHQDRNYMMKNFGMHLDIIRQPEE